MGFLSKFTCDKVRGCSSHWSSNVMGKYDVLSGPTIRQSEAGTWLEVERSWRAQVRVPSSTVVNIEVKVDG